MRAIIASAGEIDSMKVAIIDDYQDAVRTLNCFAKLQGHEVTVFNDPQSDPAVIASRLQGFDAVLLTQQRTRFGKSIIEKLPQLKLISQTGAHTAHIDVAACTAQGIVVSAGGGAMANATAELTWGLIISAVRHLPYEVAQLRAGH